MSIEQSIVIGAFREERRIESTLLSLHEFLVQHQLLESTCLVLVVADGGDNTRSLVLKHRGIFPNFQLLEPGAPVGKGRDIKEGILTAKGDLRIFMDADLATPLHHVLTVLQLWRVSRPDMIIGVRDLHKIHKGWSRRIISMFGNLCFLIVSGRYIKDTQCGFKAFSAEAAQQCFGRLTRQHWSFDMELLTIALIYKFTIVQIDIHDWEDVPNGTFSASLSNSFQFFKDLVQILRYRVTGFYRQ